MNVRDDAPPWSFFIPVTLAVMVGVLAADGIRYAISTVFDTGEATAQTAAERRAPAAGAAPVAGPESGPAGAAVREPPVSPDGVAAPVPPAGREAGTDTTATPAPTAPDLPGPADGNGMMQGSDVRELPDSMTARRDGNPEACVNGTVVRRVEGGWEQALENDAPVPCVIVH